MNILRKSIDRCKQLRRLHARLIEELRVLKEDLREAEDEGTVNPIETVSIIKSLQEVHSTIEQELQKCPPED